MSTFCIVLAVAILNSCYLESTVRLPQTLHESHVVSKGFERVCGVPNVVGAGKTCHDAIPAGGFSWETLDINYCRT
ncbi:hypothetical protein PF008_g3178 [Phytophthora fragariae]|uniref:SUEL-type lectin domain-containing protein n=1 Tax=Phytophthora fragariae TaxID=53985 RepID=A0A6G0SFH7_9STRA|nr:hypothetical protein PF008_g3178 [Phytophthora fragariae]